MSQPGGGGVYNFRNSPLRQAKHHVGRQIKLSRCLQQEYANFLAGSRALASMLSECIAWNWGELEDGSKHGM